MNTGTCDPKDGRGRTTHGAVCREYQPEVGALGDADEITEIPQVLAIHRWQLPQNTVERSAILISVNG